MSLGAAWQNDPTYWFDRTDLPSLDDYDVVADWQAAMDQWQTTNQGTPMYAPDSTTTYTRPDGSTGEWYSAGISENSPSFGLSEGVIHANTLNRKFMEMLQNPNGPGPGLGMALANMIKQRPDMIQAAYQAVGKDGQPVLLPEVISYLETLGIRPDPSITVPPPADNWSSDRLGVWNQTQVDRVGANVADGVIPTLETDWVAAAIDRIMAGTGSTYEEAVAHLDTTLNDNGYDILPNGNIGQLLGMTPQPGGEVPGPGLTPTPQPGGEVPGPGLTPTPQPGGEQPLEFNSQTAQQLAAQYPNSGEGDYPEWMELARKNRPKRPWPMSPRNQMGF